VRARRIIVGHDAEVAFWTGLRIPHVRQRMEREPTPQPFGACVAFGVANGQGELIAGVVYHNYYPDYRGIEVSCASTTPMWADPAAIGTILRYPFTTAGCVRVTALTPRRQTGATSPRRFLEGLGFKREGSVRLGFGDDNAILYGLLESEWRAGRFGPDGGALTDGQIRSEAAAGP
jgi:RimJ/RimL family protein N-acetyltransferase